MTRSFKTIFFDVFRQLFKVPLLEKKLVDKTTNKTEKSIWIKFAPNNYQYSPNSWRFVNRNGINYKLDLHDYVDWLLFWGIKEYGRDKLYSMVNIGDNIIDIGTNMGETSMNFSKLVGDSGIIHSFEPDTINHKRCADNLKLNNFKNITLNKLGLGNIEGQFRIKVDTPTNRGGNRITDTNDENLEIIQVITLDKYVSDKNMGKIDLIKIDVEGFEYNVLKGAEKTIYKFKPKFFIELDDVNLKQQNASAKMLVEFLINKEYSITNADDNSKVTEKNNFDRCHFDIICIP